MWRHDLYVCLGKVLVNGVIRQVKFRYGTCPVSRLTRSWQDFSHELRILSYRVTLNADVLQSDRLSTNKRSLDDWIVGEALRHVYKLQKVHK